MANHSLAAGHLGISLTRQSRRMKALQKLGASVTYLHRAASVHLRRLLEGHNMDVQFQAGVHACRALFASGCWEEVARVRGAGTWFGTVFAFLEGMGWHCESNTVFTTEQSRIDFAQGATRAPSPTTFELIGVASYCVFSRHLDEDMRLSFKVGTQAPTVYPQLFGCIRKRRQRARQSCVELRAVLPTATNDDPASQPTSGMGLPCYGWQCLEAASPE